MLVLFLLPLFTRLSIVVVVIFHSYVDRVFFQVVLALFVLLLALLLLVFENGVVTLLFLLVCQLPIPWRIYALHVCLLIF